MSKTVYTYLLHNYMYMELMSVNTRHARIIVEYRDHMKDMLKGGLEWLCDKRQENNRYMAKLEAR